MSARKRPRLGHPPQPRTATDRREFLTAAGAGLVATAWSGAVSAQPASPGEPTRAKGEREGEAPAAPPISRIDCQSHLFSPQMLARLEARTVDPLVYRRGEDRYIRMGDWHRKVLPNHLDVAAKLADMDRAGIELTALSINDPGPEWFGDEAAAVARESNDFIAGIVADHSSRFLGLAVLPLPDVQAALAELERAQGELGLRGLLMYTNIAGRFPDEEEFAPVWRRASELGLPVLLHPAKPLTIDFVKGYEMTSSLGNMFENTIALTRIVMSGLLDRLPELKLVCPHLGGTLPYIVGRIDHQTQVLKRGPKYLTRPPSEYLRQVYFDVVSPWPPALRLVHDLLGPERLLFASDHPWVDPQRIVDTVETLELPPAAAALIYRDNARRLFGIA